MDTLLALIIGLAAGIGYYLLDYKKMQSTYAKWFAITHKDPLPEGAAIGFVYRQPFSGKLMVAVFLSALITVLIVLTGNANLLIQLLFGVFIVLGIMVSFYVMPLALKHGPSNLDLLKKGLNKMDDLEAKLKESATPEKPPKPEPPLKEEKPKTAPKPEEKNDDKDWRSGIKDYLDD